eukprot:267884_1
MSGSCSKCSNPNTKCICSNAYQQDPPTQPEDLFVPTSLDDNEVKDTILDETGEEEETIDDPRMLFTWDINKKLLSQFRRECECSSIVEVDDYEGYKWMWRLSSKNNQVTLSLRLIQLPLDMGAFKSNCSISCDELSYYEKHNEISLAVGGHDVSKRFPNSIQDIFHISQFGDRFNSIQFKCSVEILVRYDYFGGVFSEVDKPLYVRPSKCYEYLVYGYVDEIYEFRLNKIEALPLAIYELVYKYFLMLLNIKTTDAQFVWKFNNKKDIKLFLNCTKGDVITSRKFEVMGAVFYLELTSNGWGNLIKEGNCAIWLAVHDFEKEMQEVEVLFRVICEEVAFDGRRYRRLKTPKTGRYSTAPNDFMITEKFKQLKKWNFKILVEMRQQWNMNGNETMPKPSEIPRKWQNKDK